MSYVKVHPESTSGGVARLKEDQKIKTDINSNNFKTKINIQIGNTARAGHEVRLVTVPIRPKRNPVTLGSGQQNEIVADGHSIPLPNSRVHEESLNGHATTGIEDTETEVKIERRPSKKVSALISQFNSATTDYGPSKENIAKVPPKRIKTDVSTTVLQTRSNQEPQYTETVSSQHESKVVHVETVNRNHVNIRQPVGSGVPNAVNLKFQIQHGESTQPDKIKLSNVECNTTDSADNSVRNVPVKPKPAVKPRAYKNVPKFNVVQQQEEESAASGEAGQKVVNLNTQSCSVATVCVNPPIHQTTIYVNKTTTKTVTTPSESSTIEEDVNKNKKPVLLMRHNSGKQKANSMGDQNIPSSAKNDNCDILTLPVASDHEESDLEENSTETIVANELEEVNKNVIITQNTSNLSSETHSVANHITQSSMENSDSKSGSEQDSSNKKLKRNVTTEIVQGNAQQIHVSMENNDSGNKHVHQEVVPEPLTTIEGQKDTETPKTEYSSASDRINNALNTLKSELTAMREMDLLLLKQLINISQTIQRLQRTRVLRVSKSLSFSSSQLTQRKPVQQRRYRPLERQNSAPHCADRKRMLFGNLRSSTEDEIGDSLSSFDESEFDSQSELEESTSSLNMHTISPRSPQARQFFTSRSSDVTLALDVAEDADQTYEDILRRNVKLWKLSLQNKGSVIEEVTCLL